MKRALLLIVVVLLSTLLAVDWFRSQHTLRHVVAAADGPAFEVVVVKPRVGRPLFGLLPEDLLGLPPAELRFDHSSPGARVEVVDERHLVLSADGWSLVLAADEAGSVQPITSLVFPIELADRQRTLQGRAAVQPAGTLRITSPPGSDALAGRFAFELAPCEDAETGRPIDWPGAPLSVVGSFAGLAIDRR